jgi:hypothetical protein
MQYDIANVPDPNLIAKAWMTVKARADDPDGFALFQAEIDLTDQPQGRVLDDGSGSGNPTTTGLASGTGRVQFVLTPDDTARIGTRTRKYDIKVLLTDGTPLPAEKGTMRLHGQITEDAT